MKPWRLPKALYRYETNPSAPRPSAMTALLAAGRITTYAPSDRLLNRSEWDTA